MNKNGDLEAITGRELLAVPERAGQMDVGRSPAPFGEGFLVLPVLLWWSEARQCRQEVELAAMKEDSVAVILEAAEATGVGLDRLDLGVEVLGEV